MIAMRVLRLTYAIPQNLAGAPPYSALRSNCSDYTTVGRLSRPTFWSCPLWVDPVEKGLVNIDES
jgi:hypothetical protein